MEEIFCISENNEEPQFTSTELEGVMTDYIPDEQTIKTKIEERYGDKIVITSKKTDSRLFHFESLI